jgi:hypothetical protein
VLDALGPDAHAALAAFRAAESPDPAAADRVLAALERRVPPRRRVAVLVAAGLALAAAVLLAVGLAAPGRRAEEAAAAPYQAAPAPPRPVAAPPPPPRTAAPPTEPEPPAPTGPIEHVRKDMPKKPDARRPRADDIAAEVALLREAKLAAPARRLELLAEHARRFPGGAFAAERALLEIDARCALGEDDRARELAARFPARFPGSPLAARAARACADAP